LTRTKHVFRHDVPCLQYAALGDTAVRVIAIHHAVREYDLDAIVVPLPRPDFALLWTGAFGEERIVWDPEAIPLEYRFARVSAPTSLDWQFGSAGWNVFESVLWENGFFRTLKMKIEPPILFPCNPFARAVMIYPEEHTDGNRIFDATWWIETSGQLRAKGYSLNYLGSMRCQALERRYQVMEFDRTFPPTLSGLRECVAASSLAIGGSTGPTWTCLMSDIPQIVLESKKAPHGYWFFDRCQTVLSKRLFIVSTLDSFVPRLG
jgi:hypothetical protein